MRTPIALVLLLGAAGPLPATEPPARADSYGDPLPAGAITRLGTVRNRAPITSLGVRADETVVTASSGGGIVELRMWGSGDDTGSEPRRLKTDREEKLYSPAVSADGKRVAASTTERLVVWDIAADGTTKQVAAFTAERPGNLRFSPDNSAVVFSRTWGNDQLVVGVGDIETGKVVDQEGVLIYVAATAISGNGKRVAASTAFEVHVWDAKTGERLARHELGKAYAESVALDTAGGTLAVNVGGETAVKLLDALTGKPVEKLTGPKGGHWVSFARDGKTLLLGDAAGVRWWDPAGGKLIRAFEGFQAPRRFSGHEFTPARFPADGKMLVAASNRALHRWEAVTGKPLFPVSHAAGHLAEIEALGVSADSKLIATASLDGRLRVWEAKNGKPMANISIVPGRATNVEFSPDGKTVYGSSGANQLASWDVTTGKEVRRFALDPELANRWPLAGYRMADNGKALVAIHNGVRLEVSTLMTTWNTENGERIASVELDQSWRMAMSRMRVTFSPDGKFATTCGNSFPTGDGPNGNTLGERVLGPGFEPGAFSGDGSLIAYSINRERGNRTVKLGVIYNPVTGRKVAELGDGSGGRVALSPNGKILAAAGLEDLTFWDVFSGELLARLKSPPADKGHEVISFANAIRFSPDGTYVVTAHPDTTALVWNVPPRREK